MRETILDLFRHMEWADAMVWTAALDLPRAADDAKLRGTLVHLHTVQRAFFSIWTGTPVDMPDPQSFEDLAAVCRWGHNYYRDAPPFVASAADLDAPVVLPWAAHLVERFGEVHAVNLGETMIQVAMHSTYHRAQVNSRLRELGGEPPLVDYIAWLWRGRPAPNWPPG